MLPIFRKYKLPTLLNVLGLAVALAAFYLFFTQVEYGYRFNTQITDHEKVYRVEYLTKWSDEEEWHCGLVQPIAHAIADVPHVDTVLITHNNYSDINVLVDENRFATKHLSVAKNILDFADSKLLYGSMKSFAGNSCLITRSEALRIFGKENAVGMPFTVEHMYGDDKQYTVAGVMEDLPENMFLKNGIFYNGVDSRMDDYGNYMYSTLIRIDDSSNVPQVEEAIKIVFRTMMDGRHNSIMTGKEDFVRLTPISETYFSGLSRSNDGKKDITDILFAAGLFVLLVALLNLSNYSLALAPMRIKNVNTRKVLGAKASGLRLSIIMENVVLAVLSILIATAIVFLFAGSAWCSSLSICSVDISKHVELAIVTAVMGLLVGVLSALYPAFYATNFAPAMVLKGSFALSAQGKKLRMTMLSVQFMVAFFLVVYIMLLKSQSYYIFNSDYGFDKDEILTTELSKEGVKKSLIIRDAFMQMPFVENVSFSRMLIGVDHISGGFSRGEDDRRMEFDAEFADHEYMRTYGIKVIEGRDFNETDSIQGACIVSESMMKSYPWLSIGNKLLAGVADGGWPNFTIIGVCNNVVAQAMKEGEKHVEFAIVVPGPSMSYMRDNLANVIVRVKAGYDKIEARSKLAEAMKEIDGSQEYYFQFLDDKMETTYQEEFRFISQVEVFALICILITLVGVFCLTMFESEYRRKEVALRKIMGSTTGEVIRLFTSKYVLPLILSFIIVAPVAYVYGAKWLEGFANRTPIHWWLFPLALVLVSGIVLITVVVQCWKVARSNPIESIRTE